jgi:hypothetical protein
LVPFAEVSVGAAAALPSVCIAAYLAHAATAADVDTVLAALQVM